MLLSDSSSITLAKKFYPESTSKEEIDLIQSQVYKIGSNIIFFKAIPYPTMYSMTMIMDKIEQLSKEFKYFYHISDVQNVSDKGSAKLRNYVAERLNQINNLEAIVFIMDRNIIMRTVISFFVKMIPGKPYYIVKTLDEAIKKVDFLQNENSRFLLTQCK
ncbi:MAG: hypothetical protein OEZ01_02650 [Candidatus Heimdallarchaeota archaeon]|nr:hypothetical protein [Candidatus Heimdallarchaeota archaeon]MDH5644876.1 hypothetical protein [Candidatus Heimdallarchaeota archaeon]